MHQVLIDVTRLLDRSVKGRLPTGVDRVSLAYIGHFGQRARAVIRHNRKSHVLTTASSRALFEWLQSPSSKLTAIRIVTIGLFGGWLRRLHRGLSDRDFLFNTGHSGLEQPWYPAMVKRQGVKPVFMVHDLIPMSHPEYCRPGERDRHLTRMRNALQLAAGVVCNSQATLDELTAFAKASGLAVPPAVVALLAPSVPVAQPGHRPMPEPYFVMLGTIEPRKNHWLLLQLWRSLVERLGPAAPRLVVIGQRGWECENVVDLLERCEALKGVVTELPRCSDADLMTWLHHAQALLFPSFAEGYGMPLAEALSLGVPVIASDLPVFREIAADVPDYIDPLDGKRWGELIQAYARPDSPQRAAQLQRLGGFTAPTWPEHFDKVDALLEQLDG